MSRKQSGYLQRLSNAQRLQDDRVRDHMRTIVLDIVTIALGRCGMNADDLEHFREVYMETEQDYLNEIVADYYGNKDPSITYAKDRIDRAIKEYVSDEMFVPYDERYIGKTMKK